MLEIYLDPITINCRKVVAGLDLIGTKYNLHELSYFNGEQKSEDYKKINPMATIPAAVDGSLIITESNAILQYAADLQGDDATYPKDLKQRALVNTWLLWEASAWFPSCYKYLVENVVKPLLKSEPDKTVTDAESANFHKLAGVIEKQLKQTKWLAGSEVTIADIAVASPLHLHKFMGAPLDQYTELQRWMAQVEKLECWKKTQGAVEAALVPDRAGAANGSSKSEPPVIKANFNYTKDVEGLTELYFYETEAAKHIHEPGDDPKEMEVRDGWGLANTFTADKHGFSIHDFKSTYNQWDDEEEVRKGFYPDVVDFVKQMFGAKRVLVFDHTIRSKRNAQKKLTQETNTSQRAPVTLVHCDYTAESGPTRVRQLLPDEADDLLSRRVAFLNVWKPLNVVEESPLAMCDVTTSPSDDFFKLHLRYRDRNGENYVMRHAPGHKWYYFPKMTPDKAIVLKTYDSETDGRARFVGHSAFVDPTSAPDAPNRESVEIRTIAFF